MQLEPNVLYLPGVLVAKSGQRRAADDDPIEPGSVRLAGVAPTRSESREVDQNGTVDLFAYFEYARDAGHACDDGCMAHGAHPQRPAGRRA
jgi:hypothetical protein